MIAHTMEEFKRLLKIDFIRFCIVGGMGFVVNLVLLLGLTRLFQMSLFPAQLIGAEVALFGNFMLHHNWTYKRNHVKKTIPSLLIQFHATSWPAIIGSALMVTGGVQLLHLNKPVALVVSSAFALLWNFVWSKFVIWRDVSPQEIEETIV